MYFKLLQKYPRVRDGYFLDIEYDGNSGKAVLVFLDPNTQTLFRWYDNTGHRSYLLTNADEGEAEALVGDTDEYLGVEEVEKYNSILDEVVKLRKVYASNPLAIGGEEGRIRNNNFRDLFMKTGFNVWEAWIRYVTNYCYDTGVEIGMPYRVSEERVTPLIDGEAEERIREVLKVIMSNDIKYTDVLHHWVRLLEYKFPVIDLVAVDIEVLPEVPTRMPSPIIASQPVIAVSFVSSGEKKVFLLRRTGSVMGVGGVDGVVTFFEDEKAMLGAVFEVLDSHPMVVTFNGDNFDLMYLYNRANNLGIPKRDNPIYVIQKICKLKKSLHVDLYHFFSNRSIQNYAFKDKYGDDHTLDAIAKGVLGRGKIKVETPFEYTPLVELARYCLNDSLLTYDLIMLDGGVTLNLILALCRMSNYNIYQLTRRRIGDWIKSMFYYLLRKRNWLIPSQEELRGKGDIQTKAKIDGKKYEGAIVKEPKSGIFFDVKVVDFQSLYPSEVKVRNVGFSTVNCNHVQCVGKVVVPYTTHYICTKNRAIESDVIGGLRDVRVFYYKPQVKKEEISKEERSYYGVLEQAIKVFLNASYGVFGSAVFPLYCGPVGEAITAFGRRDMTAVIEQSEKIGVEPLAGDTDSVCLHNPTDEQVDELQKWAKDELQLDLGIDKVYRYAIFSHRKKNYLGVEEDGRVDVKGMTGKKRHIPEFIKGTFREVTGILGKVNDEGGYKLARKDVWETIKCAYDKMRNREWDNLEELAFNMRLSMDIDEYKVNAQHVKAARMLRDKGYDVKAGDIVYFIKATNEEGVMPLLDADPELVDVDVYLDQMRGVFIQLLEPLEIDWGEVSGETTLLMFTTGDSFLVEFMPTDKDREHVRENWER